MSTEEQHSLWTGVRPRQDALLVHTTQHLQTQNIYNLHIIIDHKVYKMVCTYMDVGILTVFLHRIVISMISVLVDLMTLSSSSW